RLPRQPNLEHLKGEAKALHKQALAEDAKALALIGKLHPRAAELTTPKLTDAQLTIARTYGFRSWPALRDYVKIVGEYSRSLVDAEGGDDADRFLRLACLNYGSDERSRRAHARELLATRPELAGASIHTVAAVGDVAAAREHLACDREEPRRRGGPYAWEPLLYACYSRLDSTESGHSTLEVARLLLDHGADHNAGFLWEGNSPPFTALTGVFGYGEDTPNQPPHQYELELARLLLERGADPNDEQTLYNNRWRRTDEHLDLLFEFGLGAGDGGPWHRRLGHRHATPEQMLQDQLLGAAGNGRDTRVELLVRHGVDVDGRGTRRRSPSAYELAITNGATRVAELLRDAGATVTRLDDVGELLAAAMRGDRAAVERALAVDPAVAAEAITRYPGRLVSAADLGRADAVTLLVGLGYDLDRVVAVAPLHLPAYHGDRAMVDLLIELGADPTVVDPHPNGTPGDWARHAHHDELADHLDELATSGGRR
ncbi:MAG: ankyrin repeat domain-containing protein, partial [Solirubrobacteraceae bacterium]